MESTSKRHGSAVRGEGSGGSEIPRLEKQRRDSTQESAGAVRRKCDSEKARDGRKRG